MPASAAERESLLAMPETKDDLIRRYTKSAITVLSSSATGPARRP